MWRRDRVWAGEACIRGSVKHVEVFQVDGVRTSIIGRPRPLSSDRRAQPHYTLICDEPHYVAPVAIFAMLLAGCGKADDATPAAPTVPISKSSSTPAPRESLATSEASPQWDTSGPSFGVDRVQWPATAKGAHELMKSLPKTLGGESLEVTYQQGGEGESGPEAFAEYGESAGLTVAEEYMTNDKTESGEPELFRVGELLAANFGLVFACAKKTYRGTIKPLNGGHGPGFHSSKRSSKPMWFSCEIDGAQGADNFKGHAVGWTSKKAAWLVIAKDQKTARS